MSILLTQMNFLEYVEMCTHTGGLQWNLSNVILYSPKHIEQCTYKAISDFGHLSIQDSKPGTSGVHCREVPLHIHGTYGTSTTLQSYEVMICVQFLGG